MDDPTIENSGEGKRSVPEEAILELNFVPDWAKKPPGGNYFDYKQKRDGHRDRSGPDRRKPRPRRDSPGERGRGPKREHSARAPARPARREENRPYRQPEPQRPPVRIRFLPRHKVLSEVVRRIRLSGRTYPLMEPAHLFVSNPASCDVRIEVEKGVAGVYLYQCLKCGVVGMTEKEIAGHAFKEHHGDFFSSETTEAEPPAGQFTCVAQCGLSGELLAPPNHHSYQEKISEIHRLRYPDMPLDEYTSNIRTLHDEESIERWKAENTKKTLYRPKSDESVEPMSWSRAAMYFDEKMAGSVYRKSKRAILPVPAARQIADPGLLMATSDAWRRECRFPASIMAALRGAFHNKKMYLFKAGSGREITFVSAIKPVPLLPEQAIESIGEVISFLRDNPGCSREKMLDKLRPGCGMDSKEAAELLSPLGWLVERGHIIEFYDGTLSVPLR